MLASDLHVHLDGSLRDATLAALAREKGLVPSAANGEELVRKLRFRPGMSLTSCLSRFQVTVGLLQSRRTLERVARELVHDCYLDGVRHVEIRFCPALHTREGLSADDVVAAALGGAERGAAEAVAGAPGDRMSFRIVVSILEGMSEKEAGSLADLAVAFADSGVAGVDLAGDEALFEPSLYARPLSRARDAGLGVTVHAGEGDDVGHIEAAVEVLGADRIGHGVSAASDPGIMSLLAVRGIAVEICLSSNLHTGAVGSLAEHPLRVLAEAGVPVTLATDNRFFSNTSLSREYALAGEELGAGPELMAGSSLTSASAAFLPDREREELRALYAASLGLDTASPG
jgi:adenosine deaminase